MGLVLKGSTYHVRYIIPVHMRATLDGARERRRTTKTGSLREAKRLQHRIMADLEQEVQQEYDRLARLGSSNADRSGLLASVAALQEEVAAGKLEPDDAWYIASDYIDDHVGRYPEAPESQLVDDAAAAMDVLRGTASSISFGIERFIAHQTARGVRRGTVKRQEGVLGAFAGWASGMKTADITGRVTAKYVVDVLNKKKGRDGGLPSVSSVHWDISALKSAWSYFQTLGWVEHNPWNRLERLVVGKKKTKRSHWKTEEVERLRRLKENRDYFDFAMIVLHAGLRPEEVACLHQSNIDLEAGTLRTTPVGEDDRLKNASSDRSLPMHPVVRTIVARRLQAADSSGYLFRRKRARSTDSWSRNIARNINRRIDALISDDPRLVLYNLRHTYCQGLRDLGVDTDTIEFTTGHKSQDILLSTYARSVSVDRLRGPIEKLDFGFAVSDVA